MKRYFYGFLLVFYWWEMFRNLFFVEFGILISLSVIEEVLEDKLVVGIRGN